MIFAIIETCFVLGISLMTACAKYAPEDSLLESLLNILASLFLLPGIGLLAAGLFWPALLSPSLWTPTPEQDLKRVNEALASPEPVIFLAMPRVALDPFPADDVIGHFAPGMTKLESSPRGNKLNIIIVPMEIMSEALETPILKNWCIVLFVRNGAEGLLYPAYSCGVSEETWQLGASWVLGEPGSDRLPKSFMRTPVVVRTRK
jgi:hypothetical protein